MGPHSRVLIRELKLFGIARSSSCTNTDEYVLCALSRTQAEAEAASLGAIVVGIS
jgi:hypothetical protein